MTTQPVSDDFAVSTVVGDTLARLHAIFMQAPVAIAILSGPRQIIELANPMMVRVWGRRDQSQLLSLPLFEALPEAAGQGFEASLESVRTTGRSFVGRELPVTLQALDSGQIETRYFDFVYEPLRVTAGHESIIVIATDVTDGVRMRQKLSRDASVELRANEERLRRVMEASGAGIWEMDLASHSIYADARLAELFELGAAGDLPLNAFVERIAPEARAPVVAAIEQALGDASGGSFCVEVPTLPVHGRARWLEWRGKVEHEAGRAQRFTGTAVDVTARKVAELERERLHAEMARERQRLHDQLMQAPVAVSILSGPDLVYELANQRALAMAGRGDVIGKPLRDVFPELPPDAPAIAVLRGVFETGIAFSTDEFKIALDRKGSGELEDVYFQFSCEPFRDASGRVTDIVTVAVDVTAQVEARRKIESLIEALRVTDQRKDEFLATLAHELRNPMAAISTALSLLEHTAGDAERADKYRRAAQRQMTNLVRLVDDLLDVARITRGKIELRKGEVDLAAVVQHALAAVRPLCETRGHELSVTLVSGAFRMHADPTRVEQIAVNLLTNAAKYTDTGGHIAVRLERDDGGDAPFAVLRVRDDGRGIPQDQLETVFDPFTQVSPTIDRSTGGLGLGLTLVRRLVELHGGEVRAYSAGPGAGSEFVVRLPLLDAQPRLEAGREQDAGPVAPAHKRRVLVIEDSEDLRELLRELLERLGHEVFVADDGLDGAQSLLRLRPDVALIDVGLPNLDGYDVARRMRAASGARQPYLVALTGYGGAEVRERALRAGFDLQLTKPIDPQVLREVLTHAGQ
jgi:PAS domain S-box-containing protein